MNTYHDLTAAELTAKLTNPNTRVRRMRVRLSNGDYLPVAKGDLLKWLAEPGRAAARYTVTIEHHEMVGWVAYVQPQGHYEQETY